MSFSRKRESIRIAFPMSYIQSHESPHAGSEILSEMVMLCPHLFVCSATLRDRRRMTIRITKMPYGWIPACAGMTPGLARSCRRRGAGRNRSASILCELCASARDTNQESGCKPPHSTAGAWIYHQFPKLARLPLALAPRVCYTLS